MTAHCPGSTRRHPVGVMAGLVLALVAAVAVLVAPTPAHAAAEVQVDDVSFESDSFADGSTQALHVHWSVPGAATAPVTLVLGLPPELRGFVDTFTMVGPDGEAAGTCSVSADEVRCEVNEAFIRANPYGVSGEFWFNVQSQLKNKETETHTFEFGEISQTVEVEANRNWCTDNCEYTGQGHSKWGSYDNATDTITWTVQLPAPPDGIEAGKLITVTDELDPTQYEVVVGNGYPRVREGGALSYNEWDRETVDYMTKPAGEVTWSPDNLTATFTSAPGWAGDPDLGDDQVGTTGSFYLVQWRVRVLDEGKAGRYTNTASYTIEGETGGQTSGSARRYSGGATVVGRNFGRFQVTKELTGDTVLNPTFTVNYQAYDGGELIDSGTFELKSGQSYISEEFFKGTRIVLSEVQPSGPQNVDWETPVFVGPDGQPLTELTFSAENGNLGAISEIRLVNEATLRTGTITARKVVENPDGVPLDIPSYRIGYSRESAVEKGIQDLVGGQFILDADGTPTTVTVPSDVGYSFFEWFVAAPAGSTFADPVYMIDGQIIDEEQLVNLPLDGSIDLTITNRITQNVGGFQITKAVTGDGEPLVDKDASFTVSYSYDSVNGYPAGSGTVTVVAGQISEIVGDIPEGATVTLDEVRPDNPVGGTWGEPVFDVASFRVVKDQVFQISLDNPITWNDGDFTIVKVVDGDGADLVADDATFGVDYSYVLPEELGADPGTGSGTLVVANDGTVADGPDLPYGTEVTLTEQAPPDIAGGTWTGSSFDPATFTIGDETTLAVTLTNTIERDLGSFSITKSVTGSGDHLVDDGTTFTVTYSYPAGPGYEAGSGQVEVPYGGDPAVVGGLPAGAVVTLDEMDPDNPIGGTWLPEQFADGNIVTIAKDQDVAVGLENAIDLDTGAFSVVKELDGSGASLVPDDATFIVEYAYPAANGYEAGSGELEVTADGTAVSSQPLPYGAEVSLGEATPGPVSGATWNEPTFSESTITVGDGTIVEVTLTNTIAANADVDGDDDRTIVAPPGAVDNRGELPRTGAPEGTKVVLVAGLLLLALGAAFVLGARPKRAR